MSSSTPPPSESASASLPPPIPSVNPNPTPTIKKANKPFLVHQNYKKRQQELSQNPSLRKTPSSQSPSILSTTLKTLLLTLLTSLVLSRAITQTWTWGIESKYTNPHQLKALLFPQHPIILTEPQLSLHDGTNPDLPLYLAIDGDVYDVSEGGGRGSYGPGGAYHLFAGRDAARAFVTGCFETHLTHDLRGFTEKQMSTLNHWKKFYENHANYRKVGRVMHPPIDPNSPIPEPCTKGTSQPDDKAVTGAATGTGTGTRSAIAPEAEAEAEV